MAERERDGDGASEGASRHGDGTEPAPSDRPHLRMTLVRYDDAPDHCTIYPPGLTSPERVSRWVSADRGSVVALSGMR